MSTPLGERLTKISCAPFTTMEIQTKHKSQSHHLLLAYLGFLWVDHIFAYSIPHTCIPPSFQGAHSSSSSFLSYLFEHLSCEVGKLRNDVWP